MMSKFSRTEKYLLGIGLIVSLVMLYWIYSLDMIKILTDQNAHLNFSRLIFDSMTPGVSQIGFWPPLLHILLAPFTLVPILYRTGIAASIVLIPFYLMGIIFLYRTVLLLTGRGIWGVIAAILFMLNPYILYYTNTPMMEILFLANLFGVTYFFTRWLTDHQLKFLLLTGIFITLCSLSRYEGLMLIPIVTLIVVWDLITRKTNYSKIEAILILFLLLTAISVGYIALYGLVFGGNVLAFTGGNWLKTTGDSFATKHNIFQIINYILHASFYMLGKPLVWASLVSFPLILLLSRKRFINFAALMILASPLIFVGAALFSGSYSIAVPELAPFGFFNNDRYGLAGIGFAIVAPLLLLALIMNNLFNFKKVRVVVSALLILLALFGGGLQLYNISYAQKYSVIKNNINAPKPEQKEISDYLRNNYDFGKILVTRADNDPILTNANIPLRDYIYEGNYKFFDQTLAQPWLFARWVIMYNLDNDKDEWSKQNELIARKWGSSEEFANFYDLVSENDTRKLYKINESRVSKLGEVGYNVAAIPSINKNLDWWSTRNIYAEMEQSPAVGADFAPRR